MTITVLGLALSSSWGNGHATTFRALLRGMAALGEDILFLERDVPWYAANRDLPCPDFCRFALYDGLEDLDRRFGETVAASDAVIVGSYVPDGIAVIDWVIRRARGIRAFYDIDTPVTLARLDCGDCAYLAARQIPSFDVYLSFTGGPLLDRLRHRFCARRAEALYCAVDESHYRPLTEEPWWDLGYLGTYSPDRQPALDRLLLAPARRLPDRRFIVAGPQYPDDIEWPENVERVDHLPPAEHPRFYGQLRWTLNVTRADMIAAGWSPSVRLFEAGACATPVISDRWDGLSELFPDGRAIVIADDTDDVVAALSAPDEVRRAMGEAARRNVMAAHTGTARAGQLVDIFKRVRGSRAEQALSMAVGREGSSAMGALP